MNNPPSDRNQKRNFLQNPLLPFLIALAVQLPMLVLYFRELWIRPHYRFAPLAIAATLLIVFLRKPAKGTERQFSWLSGFLLSAGVVFSLASLAFLIPWFTAASLFCLIASLLSTIPDRDGFGSLWKASLPLLAIVYLPNGLDGQLLSWLHVLGSELASRILELGGMSHLLTYTTIEIPGTIFQIESSSRGLASVFMLFFAALFLAAWNRRSLFHLVALLVCAASFAVLMNTVRITAIPLAERFASFDLSSGLSHDVLGYGVLAFCLFFMLSIDQFLVFLFGPVEENTGKSGPFGHTLTYLWNSIVAGDVGTESARRRQEAKPIGDVGRYMIWGAAGILVLVGAIQAFDIFRVYNQTDVKAQFSSPANRPFSREDLPDNLISDAADGTKVSWEKGEFTTENRTAGSDLGNRSDIWIYTNREKRIQTSVSLDQTFPGWHELTVSYRNDGWQMTDRVVKEDSIEIDGESVEWPYIEARFIKPSGQESYLLFSHFDAQGRPIQAPLEWGWNSIFSRIKKQLNDRLRSSLFQSKAYQSQLLLVRFGDISDVSIELVRSQYLVARQKLRKQFLAKRNSKSDDEPDSERNEASPAPTKP